MSHYEKPNVKRCPHCGTVVEKSGEYRGYDQYDCPTDGCVWHSLAGKKTGVGTT